MSADELMSSSYAGGDDAYATRRLATAPALNPPSDLGSRGAAELPAHGQRKRRFGVFGLLLNLVVGIVVLLLLAVPAGLYALDRAYDGKIYPHIRVAGIDVGEMTRAQAETAIRARYANFLAHPATLNFNGQTWQPTAQELGIRFDFAQAVSDAYSAGRGSGLLNDLRAINGIWQNGLDLSLTASADQRAVLQTVQKIAATIERAPVDGQLALVGTTVQTVPMQIGKQVLVDETVRELTDGLRTLTPQATVLRTRELTPRLTDSATADAKTRIEAFIHAPLTLTVEQRNYVWSPDEIALMLNIARVPQDSSSDRIDVQINRLQVERRLIKMTDETGRGSVNPRVNWDGGALTIFKPGQTGLRIDQNAARQAIYNWHGEANTLAIPVNIVQPQVTAANLHSLGIEQLVSVGQSDFTGSADYRINNIGVGMTKFQGILVAPGEEFSFNDNVGSIDAANGFVEGGAIINNRVQQEFGGGICQDSTTMFRAAFWAGLPITERWGHSFYISWYNKYALGPLGDGPGLDATIFTGGPDLKFVNDTKHWLLIQSSSDPKSGVAQVSFYGTKPNRSVGITQEIVSRKPQIDKPVFYPDPKQPRGSYRRTDTKRGGMTINVYRTITENGVARKPQLFQTVFQPWADKYAFNPADLSRSGRPLIGPWAAAPAPAPAPQG